MKTREWTGLCDRNGDRIHVGDTVIKYWGWWWFPDKGKVEDYREHVVTKRQDGNVIRYCLGDCYNRWIGSEVVLKQPTSTD